MVRGNGCDSLTLFNFLSIINHWWMWKKYCLKQHSCQSIHFKFYKYIFVYWQWEWIINFSIVVASCHDLQFFCAHDTDHVGHGRKLSEEASTTFLWFFIPISICTINRPTVWNRVGIFFLHKSRSLNLDLMVKRW